MSVSMLSRSPRRVVATASGKGGVGKTVLTANLALCMAQECAGLGQEVVAIDLDLGCGNLNTCLGVRFPDRSVNDFLFNRVSDLHEVLLPTVVPNLRLVSGSYRGAEIVELDPHLKKKLMHAVHGLEADWVFLDLGAGATPDILDVFTGAGERLVVTTLESVSLHNSFLFLNGAIFRALWHQLSQHEFLVPIRLKLQDMVEEDGKLTLDQVLQELKRWDRYSFYIVNGLIAEMNFKIIVNMHRGGREKAYLEKFLSLTRKYLSRGDIQYLGSVEADERVRQSVQSLQPFVLTHPEAGTARNMRALARELLAEASGSDGGSGWKLDPGSLAETEPVPSTTAGRRM